MARGLEIVGVVCERGPLTADAIAAALDIPLSTTYRYVGALRSLGYLDVTDGRYDLGGRMLGVLRRTDVNRVLARLAAPILAEIVRRTGETALLTVPVGWTAMCVDSVQPRRPVPLSYRPGVALPLHAGASAKLLLAHLPGGAVREYLRGTGLIRFTNRTVTVEDLFRQLDHIRRTGVCVTSGELDPDKVGVGVPVTWDGQVAACLSVAGPGARLPPARIRETAELLRGMSARLTRMLAGDAAPVGRPEAAAFSAAGRPLDAAPVGPLAAVAFPPTGRPGGAGLGGAGDRPSPPVLGW